MIRHPHKSNQPGQETGATGVEMALVLPLLVLLIAGVMDFGMVFSDLMSLRHGVGAGIRHGIVAQSGGSTSCTLTGASGAPTATKELMCLVKDRIALDESSTRTKIHFPGAKIKGGSLVICAQYPMESITTILEPVLDGELTSKVEMRIEQDLSALSSAEETPLDGGDWSWCS